VHYIRHDRARGRWSVADWEARKHALDAVFKEADADLMAFQEMVSFGLGEDRTANLARDWLLARNPGYAVAASGDWRRFPTRQPIFYRTDRLRLLDHGWFLFDPPEVLARERARRRFWLYYASWADFEDRQGGSFRAYNLHFHYLHRGRRREAARLAAAHISEALDAGMPVLVLADMNALRGWQTTRILQAPGLRMVDPPGSSFHFNKGLHILGPIDRLGHSAQIDLAAGPWTLRGRRAGDWPSDHYPVVADVLLP